MGKRILDALNRNEQALTIVNMFTFCNVVSVGITMVQMAS